MRTALALTSTAIAVLFATFLAAYCLRLIGPACSPARDPYPCPETGVEFDHPRTGVTP